MKSSAVSDRKTGVTREQAESDLTAIVTRQRQYYGDVYLKKTGVHLVQLRDEIVGSVRSETWRHSRASRVGSHCDRYASTTILWRCLPEEDRGAPGPTTR